MSSGASWHSSKKEPAYVLCGCLAMRGIAIVEFTLALPFLFILMFGLVECYQSFSHYQTMSVLARELGSAAFRLCVPEPDGAATVECLRDVANKVTPYTTGAEGVLPGARVIIKIYRYNATHPFFPVFAGQYSNTRVRSRINNLTIAGNASQPGLHCYGPEKGSIVTTEVFYWQKLPVGLLPRNLYQVSVY